MPSYLPINLPPGFRNHGVDGDSIGRWRDGNLVRWETGVLRPIGGWTPLLREDGPNTVPVTVPLGQVPRAMHIWQNNKGEAYIAVGTNESLFVLSEDTNREFIDRTPTGFVPEGGVSGLGYGNGVYGQARPYGQDGIAPDVQIFSVWSLDNFGEQLICCTSNDKQIYVWDLLTSDAEQLVPITPPDGDPALNIVPTCEYLIVTAERFVFALAADGNPRLIRWCDRENYNDWEPRPTNEAGDIELQTSGSIQGAIKVRGRTLILTSTDAHVAIYQGPPTVYGFQRVGVGCGLVSPLGVAAAAFGAFWMGSNGFYVYDGNTVQEIACEVQDKVFEDINRTQFRKIFAVANERAKEVWWFYPSAGSPECDRYVAFDYKEGHWLIGELSRSAGGDLGVFGDPIWMDQEGNVYRHEIGDMHGGVDPWIESGPIRLNEGQRTMQATKFIQDERVQGQVSVEFDTRYWPNDVVYNKGPYALSNATDVRFSARQIRMRLTGKDNTDWRIGDMRLEVTPRGRR